MIHTIASCYQWLTGKSRSRRPRSKDAARAIKPNVESLEARIVPAWAVSDLNTITANALVQTLVGTGVTATNIKYTGAKVAAGKFTDSSNATGITTGVVLSSGTAKGVAGPNSSGAFGSSNGTPSDVDLDKVIAPQLGFDAATLEFDFTPKGSIVSFTYVFGSDEYPEFVGSINDAFALIVNGKNVALVPGTSTPVSINNVSPITNTKYYVDNTGGLKDTQMDGFTTVLPVTLALNPGISNHIKMTIEDASDSIYDSWVLIRAGGFASAEIKTFAPLRFVYNAVTAQYSGQFLISNINSLDVPGPLYVQFPSLPAGVTVVGGGKTSQGKPYFAFPGGKGLPAHSSLYVTLNFKNPGKQDLGSFFTHTPIQIVGVIQ